MRRFCGMRFYPGTVCAGSATEPDPSDKQYSSGSATAQSGKHGSASGKSSCQCGTGSGKWGKHRDHEGEPPG